MTFNEIRRRADRVRGVQLESVLLVLGAQRDRDDKSKWHTAKGAISVTGTKFMSWSRSVGGGGAIDLVIHLSDMDFKAAVEWLSHHFPVFDPPERSQVTRRLGLELPPRDTQKLPALRQYLTQERRLPASLIEPLIECGTLYADPRSNAVFLLLGEEGKPVGAEIRGTTRTPWRGMAPGSRKDLGYFCVTAPQPRAVILCESAIDAVSCLAITPQTCCISTAGARPEPTWLTQLTQSGQPIYCGFDSDLTGDDMARAMIAKHPAVTRLRPPLKDWNEVLQSRR